MRTQKANQKQINRQRRVRAKLSRHPNRPRLHVHRSHHYIYAQIIDDLQGKTLVAASDHELKDTAKLTKTQKAIKVGELIAQKSQTKKIVQVRFDRGAYKYHGRIKALADSARKGGLNF